VRHGLGGHERIVPVAPETMGAVAAWLDARQTCGIPASDPLCGSLRKGPLSVPYIRKLLSRLGRQAGIKKRVHALGFRHRFTARLARQRVDITSISYVLGHQSIASTYEYLRDLGLNHALDDIQRALDTQDRFAGGPGDAECGLPPAPMARAKPSRPQATGQKRDQRAPSAGSLRQHKRDQRRAAGR
jgi:hypothetical protein